MKSLLTIILLILLLTACAPVPPQTMVLPANEGPAAPGMEITTPQVKVVEMATLTSVPTTLPTMVAEPTIDPNVPTPTGVPVALPQTLEELGIPATTYEDKVAGLAIDYPATWEINALPEDIRIASKGYTASLRSPYPDRGPKQQEGIPPDMAAIDLTVIADGPTTLEQAIAERRAATTTNEFGLTIQIALEEEWVLRDGTVAHRFLYNLGKDPLGGYGDRDKLTSELVTIINGKMVLVSGMGDLSLFNVVAASLRQVK